MRNFIMRDRIMRSIVFFDLPNIYAADRKNYNKFRRFLINNGFIMVQESVYSKLVMNGEQASLLFNKVKNNAPKKGVIQMLTITERQYASMEYIIGSSNTKVINDESSLIIL